MIMSLSELPFFLVYMLMKIFKSMQVMRPDVQTVMKI